MEYSRDTVHVHVVALTDIRLHTPTKKIVVGGTLPVHILGQVNIFIIIKDNYVHIQALQLDYTIHKKIDLAIVGSLKTVTQIKKCKNTPFEV